MHGFSVNFNLLRIMTIDYASKLWAYIKNEGVCEGQAAIVSCHVAIIYFFDPKIEKVKSSYINVFSDDTNQDTAKAIYEETGLIVYLEEQLPFLRTVSIQSDNCANYHSTLQLQASGSLFNGEKECINDNGIVFKKEKKNLRTKLIVVSTHFLTAGEAKGKNDTEGGNVKKKLGLALGNGYESYGANDMVLALRSRPSNYSKFKISDYKRGDLDMFKSRPVPGIAMYHLWVKQFNEKNQVTGFLLYKVSSIGRGVLVTIEFLRNLMNPRGKEPPSPYRTGEKKLLPRLVGPKTDKRFPEYIEHESETETDAIIRTDKTDLFGKTLAPDFRSNADLLEKKEKREKEKKARLEEKRTTENALKDICEEKMKSVREGKESFNCSHPQCKKMFLSENTLNKHLNSENVHNGLKNEKTKTIKERLIDIIHLKMRQNERYYGSGSTLHRTDSYREDQQSAEISLKRKEKLWLVCIKDKNLPIETKEELKKIEGSDLFEIIKLNHGSELESSMEVSIGMVFKENIQQENEKFTWVFWRKSPPKLSMGYGLPKRHPISDEYLNSLIDEPRRIEETNKFFKDRFDLPIKERPTLSNLLHRKTIVQPWEWISINKVAQKYSDWNKKYPKKKIATTGSRYFSGLKLPDLQEQAEARGLRSSGTKQDIIDRLTTNEIMEEGEIEKKTEEDEENLIEERLSQEMNEENDEEEFVDVPVGESRKRSETEVSNSSG